MQVKDIASAVESIAFASGDPVSIMRLKQVLSISEEAVLDGIDVLVKRYEAPESGLSLICKDENVQLVTKSSAAAYLESFAKSTLQESLSKAALEVLSVIAYRGPISRAEIEAIRGVNCSVTMRNLLMRELIERKENNNDARGYLYAVSFQFLRELGLTTIEELPDYAKLLYDERILAALNTENNTQQEQK